MSNLPASLLVPAAPQVNLIPPEVASRKAAGRKRGAIFVAFLVLLITLGGVTFLADGKKRSAETSLKTEIERGTKLQAEIATYAEVPLVKSQTANAISAAQYAAATEIRWIDFFSLVAGGIPGTITLDTWTLGVSPPQTASAPSTDPFASPDIGVLAFGGSSLTYPDVSALERSLNAVKGFHNTSIPTVSRTVADGVVKYVFTGTTKVTAEALDQRFTEAADLKITRTRALIDLMERESDAAIAVWVAEAALAAGVEGASDYLATALAHRDAASKESQGFLDLLDAYTSTQAALATAQAAVDAGTKGADADLAAAQEAADGIATAMDGLATAITERAKAQKGIDEVGRRISAAENLVASKEAALANAQALVDAANAAGVPAPAGGVAYAQQLVTEAKDVLAKEKEPLAAATTAEKDAQAVVDKAIAAIPAALSAAQTSGEGGK